jgi:DNA repair exonuclease SbcCD ATPase subunit
MITIQELRWSNAFSYGADNQLVFTASPLVQLVGKNGHGKSSIALILEEVLFNKNSKGIKKADILNRYLGAKSYTIELDFDKDGVAYTIKSTRATTQTVKLFKNGQDISSHTATATYKAIESLIGIDHKTFCQIVYQSHAGSLEFLTATDSNRKKFLIELLDLGKYTRAQEVFKQLAQETTKKAAAVESRVKTIEVWLAKYSAQNLDPKPFKMPEYSEVPADLLQELAAARYNLANLETKNRQIQTNTKYRQLISQAQQVPPAKPPELGSQESGLAAEVAKLEQVSTSAKAFIKRMQSLRGTCATCMQPVDKTTLASIIAEKTQELNLADTERGRLRVLLSENAQQKLVWQNYQTALADIAKYTPLIDPELPAEILSLDSLAGHIDSISLEIKKITQDIQQTEKYNQEVQAHNTKVQTLQDQLAEFTAELAKANCDLGSVNKELAVLAVLNKTFSNTGLVAYKIETLVKDLETLANKYLVDLSDGRFQISFQVDASDKLNVIITDNGKDIDILALSGGERARVNVAALLAIRKLMQGLSNSRFNLLILDETIENLDVEGKEKLIEVLLDEPGLNTVLVSHGFQHPLLDKVHVIKDNNISRIEL